jgi:hypothetical protein
VSAPSGASSRARLQDAASATAENSVSHSSGASDTSRSSRGRARPPRR